MVIASGTGDQPFVDLVLVIFQVGFEAAPFRGEFRIRFFGFGFVLGAQIEVHVVLADQRIDVEVSDGPARCRCCSVAFRGFCGRFRFAAGRGLVFVAAYSRQGDRSEN